MTGGAPAPKLHVPVPVWVPILSWLAVLGVAVMLVLLVRAWWRRHHRPKISDSEASVRRWVNWVASRWMWDARNLGLVLVDDTTRHRHEWWTGRTLPPVVRIPDIRFEPAPHGLRAWMRTVPGVGLDQVTKTAGHLANAWGCLRVDVTQHSPGLLLLRGFVRDPLATAWHGHPQRPAAWRTGSCTSASTTRPTRSACRWPTCPGITVAGVPGTGKTSLQRWWLCQLAPHPAVQIAVLDGKVSDPADGDYGLLLPRCFAAAGDDLEDANRLLGQLYADHAGPLGLAAHPAGHRPVLGRRPHRRLPAGAGLRGREPHLSSPGRPARTASCAISNVWYLTKLAKEGRSRGFLTVFVTQKQTADAIPTAIRDVCQVGLSFGVRTMDGAVAALGDEIRQYPDVAPTNLIGREWTGVAVMRLPDRAGYHRVRTPHVTEADAAQLVEAVAQLRRAPHTLQSSGRPMSMELAR